ncbi:acyl-CoA dehydrogenase [Mariprofundus ferrinatatus]|uniref:Acyl-coenzyme A dehydrogenase n=1 Tax=Mariprofundus ferrinatatus TaxID=1921087 RepID=A0A2K8L2W6_9PROT|nr:acyl-CoA dehydrogenase [Mariprofundus ferrinatatus]ATX81593.1 acyl-CoA dehydrogenase [Mariprofundus ferrinatatus]
MFWILLLALLFGSLLLLVHTRLSLQLWLALLAVSDVLLMSAGMNYVVGVLLLLLIAAIYLILCFDDTRRMRVSRPLLDYIRNVLPPMSQTERDAVEAGTVWWDAELFQGNPDWNILLSTPKPELSEEEQAFLDGPVNELCGMLDDWQINHELRDLPAHVWDFIRSNGFFGMIIPKSYGGLEFSAYAHGCVIQKIASRSGAAAVTVMVPNSLGPAELLLAYGSDEQKDYYLPRLASGEEIPCFALTGPDAGSDAGSIPDTGIVCKVEFEGRETLGLRLNWEKRYITLGPIATVLGLAFHAYDPEHLLGEKEDLGITCALVPANFPGVEIGARHDPLNIAFLNGPNYGRDVFIPLEWVIGGEKMIGKGWRMLVERLSIGRGISLPSLSAAAGKMACDTAGSYARLRKQFRTSIGRFEGVEEALGRIGGMTYMMDATVRLTTSALDQGEKPAVLTAIAKRYLTESMRQVINDAMDVHGGRGICLGPSNYLGRTYQSIPVAITVEGANILTRNMMVFGQGAMRCHPWLQKEIEAASVEDGDEALLRFDEALMSHIRYTISNAARAALYGLTGGYAASSPVSGVTATYYRQIARYSAAMSAMADLALLTLGGTLKRKESISGRFADAMAYLYLASAVLKRFEDEGRQQGDLPLVHWSCQFSLYQVEQALAGVIRNFPIRLAAWKMRAWAFPLGMHRNPPNDHLTHQVAKLLIEPSGSRERLVAGIYSPADEEDMTGRLHHAMALTIQVEPIEKRLHKAGIIYTPDHSYSDWIAMLVKDQTINREEGDLLMAAKAAVRNAIMVDDFPIDMWGGKHANEKELAPI